MINLTTWTKNNFNALCQEIIRGLGMAAVAREFPSEGIEKAFTVALTRESTDGMFRSDETWLCIFERRHALVETLHVDQLIQATIASDVGYLLLVTFGRFTSEAEAKLRDALAQQRIEVIILSDQLAESLALDYGTSQQLHSLFISNGFSFAKLRVHAKAQVEIAVWRKHFQTASIQPVRLLPLQPEEAVIAEADLFRAYKGSSFLLLGDPGAGKTTSLLALANDLAEKGGRTPIFLPLGRYQGDFWNILCEALAPSNVPVSRVLARELVSSGALVLLLDGINEIQNIDLHTQLITELNRLTAPDEPTSNSRWIVSGRTHDYEQSRTQLINLESHRWEMQPFTADLVFQFLADALGKAKGLSLYHNLGQSVRDVCANPLLLNMVLTIFKETGQAPSGKGALYRQFIELLLRWGSERGLGNNERDELGSLLDKPLNESFYVALTQESLTALAASMSTTMIQWTDAIRELAAIVPFTHNAPHGAALLLEDLTRRGILRRDTFNRISFFHHTVQEYFQARHMVGEMEDDLIPSSGVPASRREALIFLVGLLPNPIPLIKKAMRVDSILAYEMIRDVPRKMPSRLIYKLATTVWGQVIGYKQVIGDNRRIAQVFKDIADMMNSDVEMLAARIDTNETEVKRAERLMKFYAELGDEQAQNRILMQSMIGEEIPEELLFQAAIAASDTKQVVELYTRYIEKNPSAAAAYGNRANAYKSMQRFEEAEADYKRAIELGAVPNTLTNYARLLHELGRKEEARQQVELALKKQPRFAPAHALLADWLESEDQEAALLHREQAVRFAPHDDDLRRYCRSLATLQEKLGHYAGAIRSLRQMIALDPTSNEVAQWKKRIAGLRQMLDAEARTQSARALLQEKGELPLPRLTVEWLRAAGLSVKSATSAWLSAEAGRGLPSKLPVVLMPEPIITGSNLRAAIDSVPRQARDTKHIVIVSAAESLSSEAYYQLAALQDEYTVALITALEVRDALLQSDRECRRLLDRSLQRAGKSDRPFEYKGIVRERTEFFGRNAEIEDLSTLIARGQQVGLFGIHKIGKSSLLEQLRRKLHLSNPEITIVEFELNASIKEAGDFYREVIERLPGWQELPTSRLLTALSFRQALMDFHHRREREHPTHKVVLMLDEYAYLIPDRHGSGGIRGFIEVLGILKSLHQEGWLLVLPCGRTAAINRVANWGWEENPFVDLLHSRFLGPLTPPENESLITTLGIRAKLKFTPEALASIYAETGGHPAFSRALGSQIHSDVQGEVSEEHVQDSVNRLLADRDQRSILQAIYEDRLDADEQEIVRKIAVEGPLLRKQLFPANAATDRRRQIRDAIANLLDTTVLVQHPEGAIDHRYGLLRRIIQIEAQELGF